METFLDKILMDCNMQKVRLHGWVTLMALNAVTWSLSLWYCCYNPQLCF